MEAASRGVTNPSAVLHWKTSGGELDLSCAGAVMGVLNLTPDSFSDGGRFSDLEAAVDHALQMVGEGAQILDLGGESTRPGSQPVSAKEELARVLPVLRCLRKRTNVLLSIDTSKSEVAAQALDEGADIVNDVTALRGDPKMLELVAKTKCGVVLMHMRGTPADMQQSPDYSDVVTEVCDFLISRVELCIQHGIDCGRLCVDPGIGFGKSFEHNRDLLNGLPRLCSMGLPVLIGISRKAFLGQVTGITEPRERLWAGVAVTGFARRAGAHIFRVHDVRENLHALRVTESILSHA
jgi:dihydropteroate synthase